MSNIVFPKLDIQNADVGEVTTYLNIKSREIQMAPGAQPSEVNLVVKADEESSTVKISLNAENISYRDALEEVARQTSLRLTLFRKGAVLSPKSEKIPTDPWQ